MSQIKCNECGVEFERCEADICFTTDLTEPDTIQIREASPVTSPQGLLFEARAEFHLDVQVSFGCPECGGEAQGLNGETCFEVELGES